MKKGLIVVLMFVFQFVYGRIESKNPDQLIENVDRCFFIENKGQWPEEVLFLARLGGMNTWITKDGLVMDFYQIEKENNNINKHDYFYLQKYKIDENSQIKGHVVKIKWLESNEPVAEGKNKQDEYYNYFIDNDSSKWVSFVGLYKEVKVKEIYPGVNIRYYFDRGKVRFDFEIAPGVNPEIIKWKIEGSEGEEIVENELRFKTRFGWVSLMDLRAFQENKDLIVKYKKEKETWSFDIKEYNNLLAIVIDPLIWSTFIGGTWSEDAYSMIVDNDNNIYITGYTLSNNFPTTIGGYDKLFNSKSDIFVTKLNSIENKLIYSTFIGGDDIDAATYLTIDNNNNVYITGYTFSNNFPTIYNSYDISYNGGECDAFIVKLNSIGNRLIYSTYLGGENKDKAEFITIDNNNNVYITGYTNSLIFPDTYPNVYNTSLNGDYDIFITKLNSTGSKLLYSTYIGGNDGDFGVSLAIDSNNNIYIIGTTYSIDYPITKNAYDKSYNGIGDIFITKLNLINSNLIYSTFIGGSGKDIVNSIIINNDNLYITGCTNSYNFPTTRNAYDISYNGGKYDAFIIKLNLLNNNLIYSTFIGGEDEDEGTSIVIDNNDNIYITGITKSEKFPITYNAYDTLYNGGNSDIFIVKLNSTGSDLLYSTYFGGIGEDEVNSIIINNDNLYITGHTNSYDFPITHNAYDKLINGKYDIFVTKFSIY